MVASSDRGVAGVLDPRAGGLLGPNVRSECGAAWYLGLGRRYRRRWRCIHRGTRLSIHRRSGFGRCGPLCECLCCRRGLEARWDSPGNPRRSGALPVNMDWTPPILQTKRLILRPVTPEDAQAVFDYASNPNVTRFTLFETHQTID